MNKNISGIKKYFIHIFLLAFVTLISFGSCDTAYQYDIEDGVDDNESSEPNITVNTDGGIDVSMYEKARIFPGLVDTLKEKRIDVTIELNLSKRYSDPRLLGVVQTPEPIYSTGLYAGAGEQVVITVDDNTMGLSIIVGSHMEDLTDMDPYQRMPMVYVSKALFPGKNVVKNPLGGTIWIRKSEGLKKDGICSLKFEGVYKSPDFVLGKTNLQEWKKRIKETTVPWLEISGEHFAFTVQRSRIENNLESISSTIEEVTKEWDEAIEEFYYEYYGLKSGEGVADNQRSPEFPIRVVLDVLVRGNLYLDNSDYAIIAINNNYMLDELFNLSTLRTGSSVALFRAINEMNSNRALKNPWPKYVKPIVNTVPLYRMAQKGFAKENVFGDIFPGEENIATLFPKAIKYAAADSSKWVVKDKADKNQKAKGYNSYLLLSLAQLANYNSSVDDWAMMKALNTKTKDETYIDDTNLNYFVRFASDYFKQNFSPFFDQWGIEITDEARTYGEKYPLIEKKLWNYNPLFPQEVGNYDGSAYPHRHNRSAWTVKAYDKYYTANGAAEALIDSEKETRWTAKEDGNGPDLPYYLIFDMAEMTDINGVYFANGESDDRMADIHVEYLDGTTSDPNDPDAPWTTLLQITDADEVKTNLNNERFYGCAKKQVQYLRVKIANPSARNLDHMTEEDKRKKEKCHSLAEFGTYYIK